jgi:hypothetical protein
MSAIPLSAPKEKVAEGISPGHLYRSRVVPGAQTKH